MLDKFLMTIAGILVVFKFPLESAYNWFQGIGGEPNEDPETTMEKEN